MAAHRPDTHAQAVYWHSRQGLGAKAWAAAQDLVGLGAALPLFQAGAVAAVAVDPGDQAAAQRDHEVLRLLGRQSALRGGHLAVDVQDGAGRIVQQGAYRGVQRAVLRQQLTHVLRAAATGRLIGGGRHPLHQVGLEQRPHTHQHAAHRAVAADVVLDALAQRVLDDGQVDGVQDDDRVVLHAQRLGGIDPGAFPAGGAQLRIDGLGVVTALAGDDDVAALERSDVVRVLQRAFVLAQVCDGCGQSTAGLAGAEEHRFDEREVAFGAHAVHQHRADHATPANQSYESHFSVAFAVVRTPGCPRLVSPGSWVGARRFLRR